MDEIHPSQIKGIGKAKEGFSLFGLWDRTRTRGGRRCLREWFGAPLACPDAIQARQDGVALFLNPENKELEAGIVRLLRKVKDIPKVVLRIKKVRCVRTTQKE